MKARLFACISAIVCSPVALAGPFGLDMGMTLLELKARASVEATNNPNVFKTTKVPSGHDAFESYLLFVTPKAGLCKISALGKTVTTNVYGERIRSEFNKLHEQLIEKYGESKKFDYLKSRSIWNESRDWMMGLQKQERVLSAVWPPVREATEVPGTDVASIMLEARALSTESGYIRLGYEFKNFDECRKESSARSKDAL
jgi:hypothetical protein